MKEIREPRIGVHVLLENSKKEVLILRRSKTDKNEPLHWDLPGGGLDDNEEIEIGAIREVKEETGLDVSGIKIIGAYTIDDDSLQFIAKAKANSEDVVLSFEHDEYKWVSIYKLNEIKKIGIHLKVAIAILFKNERILVYPNY